jgi:hypothetical protein
MLGIGNNFLGDNVFKGQIKQGYSGLRTVPMEDFDGEKGGKWRILTSGSLNKMTYTEVFHVL